MTALKTIHLFSLLALAICTANAFGQGMGSFSTAIPSGLNYHSSSAGGGGGGSSGRSPAQIQAERERQARVQAARVALDKKITEEALKQQRAQLAKTITKLYNQSATIRNEGQKSYDAYAKQKSEIESNIYSLEQKIKDMNFAAASPPEQAFRESDFKEMHEVPPPAINKEVQQQKSNPMLGSDYAGISSSFSKMTSSGPDENSLAQRSFSDKALDLAVEKFSTPISEWHATLASKALDQVQALVNGTLTPEEAGAQVALLKTNITFVANQATGMLGNKAVAIVEEAGRSTINVISPGSKGAYDIVLESSKEVISKAKQGMEYWGLVKPGK